MPIAHELLSPMLAQLRAIALPVTEHRILPFGISRLDACLNGGGLRGGGLHEATATTCSLADDAAATLFLAGVATREALRTHGPVLWASCRNDLYAPGLAQAGLRSASVIHAQPLDDATLLAVVEDAVRDGTPSAVVAEVGRMSMASSRRLQLVAADADMPVLVLRRRQSRERDPLAEPSAACTRWRIGSVPSERLRVAGVGRPRWLVELARQRGGEPFSMILEGCDETGRLAVPAASVHRAAETTGAGRAEAA